MSNKEPLVSWIIATYNNADTIQRCINSIFKQTYKNFEVIIVNDCSNDDTANILEINFLQYSNKIKIISNKNKCGLAYSLNKAYKLSQGSLIARIDGDDYSAETRLEEQVNFLTNNPKISVVSSRAFIINDFEEVIYETKIKNLEENFYAPNQYNQALNIIHPSVLIRRTFLEDIGLYDSRLKRAQDLDLWLRGIKFFHSYYIIDKPLIFYKKPNYSLKKSFIIFLYSLFITYKNKCFLKLFLWNLISLCLNILKN